MLKYIQLTQKKERKGEKWNLKQMWQIQNKWQNDIPKSNYINHYTEYQCIKHYN